MCLTRPRNFSVWEHARKHRYRNTKLEVGPAQGSERCVRNRRGQSGCELARRPLRSPEWCLTLCAGCRSLALNPAGRCGPFPKAEFRFLQSKRHQPDARTPPLCFQQVLSTSASSTPRFFPIKWLSSPFRTRLRPWRG